MSQEIYTKDNWILDKKDELIDLFIEQNQGEWDNMCDELYREECDRMSD